MQPEDYITAALRKLAEQDCDREAPPEVEQRLLQAFRQKQAQQRWRGWRNGLTWCLAAAAGIVVVLLGVRGWRVEAPAPQPLPPKRVATGPSRVAVVDPPQAETPVAEQAAPAPARKSPFAHPVPPSSSQSREVVTEFFPLLDVAPPFERGELLRVTVPMATMRKVGLPVNEDRLSDRVYADVLVGEEGLARAIRFVSYE